MPEATDAQDWIAHYRGIALHGDALVRDEGDAWRRLFDVLAAQHDDLLGARTRLQRSADEVSAGYRLPGEQNARHRIQSPVPLLIDGAEWQSVADALVQRAELMELLLADIYGSQRLTGNGLLPAALLNGSPHFLRPMVGLTPPGGHFLNLYAADLGRDPDGGWRVLADHTRTPTGAGYALENRLAIARAMPGLQARFDIERLAPFFSTLREGLDAACHRADPRIALLTPGRLNPHHGEHAHLARYLGLLLVESEDLTVNDDQLWLRTIEGLKRVDAVWRQIDPRLLDPLAFDSRSRIGVAGLIDAMASGKVAVINVPGSGVLEAPAFAAFLPSLSLRLTGEPLRMPNIATWWCGQDGPRAEVIKRFDRMLIAPAFPGRPRGLPQGPAIGGELDPNARAALLTDLDRRGVDYVGQEIVRLSTMPTVHDDGTLVPRPFVVRAFAARDGEGQWRVMPGGFARIGENLDVRAAVLGDGVMSADICVLSRNPVMPVTRLAEGDGTVRRNPGTLPSRIADNFFWLGRYLERAEATLALVRVALGGSADGGGSAMIDRGTVGRVAQLLVASGAAARRASRRDADRIALAQAALDDGDEESSVTVLLDRARAIGEGLRERLGADVAALLDAPLPRRGSLFERAALLRERLAALAGLAGETMARTAGWRFLDLGRRIERAITLCRLLRALGSAEASADDLTVLLDLTSSGITARQRYPEGFGATAVRDLIGLDPGNPRSIAFQVVAINRHLDALPQLADDGMAEPQQMLGAQLVAELTVLDAARLDTEAVQRLENRLLALSDAIARRFFLQDGSRIRAAGLTLA